MPFSISAIELLFLCAVAIPVALVLPVRSVKIPFLFMMCAWTACLGNAADEVPPQPRQAPTGAISVQLSGSLSTAFTIKPEADEGQLISATIFAGGTVIYLDWSRSPTIRRELLWWSIPRAGDYREPHADVTGRMVFKPFNELDQRPITVPHGVSASTPVPVVVIESIKVYLADSDGKPRGPQPDRGVVEAETTTD